MTTIHNTIEMLAYWWHRLTTSSYVLHLERENKRLLAENRALWETVWGTRGFRPPERVNQTEAPPIAATPAPKPNLTKPTSIRPPRVRTVSVRDPKLAHQAEQDGLRQVEQLRTKLHEEIAAAKENAEAERTGTHFAVTEAHGDPTRVAEEEQLA